MKSYNSDLVPSKGLRVRISNNQFIVPQVGFLDTGVRTVNQSQKEILLSPVASNPATLGRYFFTSAYLMVGHDAQTFTLWQANPLEKSTLTPVASKSTAGEGCEEGTESGSSNPSSTSGSSISTGAIVGAAVGGAAALALLAALAFLLLRRRRQKDSMTPLVTQQECTNGSGVTYYQIDSSVAKEMPGTMPQLAEMRGDEYHRPRELHGDSLVGGSHLA